MKKLTALALGTVMAVSMTAGVSAATVESKDDLKNATIGVQLGTTGVWTGHDQLSEIRTETYINRNHFLRI